MNLYLLLSHNLTPEQIQDAQENWQVKNFVALPEHLQTLYDWLKQNCQKGDLILIQGDFGATYLMVQYAWQAQLIPLYSTTKRNVQERILPDGSVHTERFFVHQRFRIYEKID
jgi:hypothetical protein